MTDLVELGAVAPTALERARLDVHWAIQPLAAFGQNFVTPREDDSHRSLVWDTAADAFLSDQNAEGTRVGLRPTDLTLFLSGKGRSGERSLMGESLDGVYSWLANLLGTGPLDRPEYEIPPHPTGDALVFGNDTAGFGELASWSQASAQIIGRVREANEMASPIRVWPHHFDIATLLTVPPATGDQAAKTIGFGMTPGDGSYAEPYFYAGPYPYPEYDGLPDLEGEGHWHTEGWFGAVLTGSDLVSAGDAAAQRSRADAFAASAIEACRTLLLTG